MKKAVFFLIFLLLIGGTVFYFGWVQFLVPAGMTGVFVSKTSGVDTVPIENGIFCWRWEKLIPTNADMRLFSKTPITVSNHVFGQLPSAGVYGSLVPGKPDFTYDFTVQTVLTAKPESLPELVSRYNILNQADFETYLQEQANTVSQAAAALLLTDTATGNAQLSTEEYLTGINAQTAFSQLDIIAITVTATKLPDIAVYTAAKQTYTLYEEQTRAAVVRAAEIQSVNTASDSLEISRLKNWGELLNQYPILIEFFAVTNETESRLEMVKTLRAHTKP